MTSQTQKYLEEIKSAIIGMNAVVHPVSVTDVYNLIQIIETQATQIEMMKNTFMHLKHNSHHHIQEELWIIEEALAALAESEGESNG